jgi:hypothetical protein
LGALNSLCDILRRDYLTQLSFLGVSISDADAGFKQRGMSAQYLLDDGLYDEKAKTWNICYSAGTTLGDLTCEIEHNREVVVRTMVMDD